MIAEGVNVLALEGAVPIEGIKPGNLLVDFQNRPVEVTGVDLKIHALGFNEIKIQGVSQTIRVTCDQLIASPLAPLPEYRGTVDIARKLRKEQTHAECILWEELRNRKTEYKWRRQHRIREFILDFFCPEIRTAIEVDGGVHDEIEQFTKPRDVR